MGYLCNIRRQLGKAIDFGNEIVSLDLLGESREASTYTSNDSAYRDGKRIWFRVIELFF